MVSVTAGAEHSLAATDDGEAFSWGWGRYGNLGDGCVCDRCAQPLLLARGQHAVLVASCWTWLSSAGGCGMI